MTENKMNIKELTEKYESATLFIAEVAYSAGEEAAGNQYALQRANEVLETADKVLLARNNKKGRISPALIEHARDAAENARDAKRDCELSDDEAKKSYDFWESFNKDHFDKAMKQAEENAEKYGL